MPVLDDICHNHTGVYLQCSFTGFNGYCLLSFQDGSYLAEFLLNKGYKVREKPDYRLNSTTDLSFGSSDTHISSIECRRS